MDLKNLLAQPDKKRETLKKRSSIQDLVNIEAPSSTDTSPVLNRTAPVVDVIRARSSISSLTNDTDVDVDGKETPSIARRFSQDTILSASNSPVIAKKTIQPRVVADSANPERRSATEELEKLEKLAKKTSDAQYNGKRKPKRYSKPPIWATKWVPKFREEQHHQQQQGPHSTGSVRAGGDPNHISSITGVKPYSDITRRITNWIYAQIHAVPRDQREFLELEVKFGRLWHKQSDRRVHIPVTNECLVEENFVLDCQYQSQMDKEHFERAKKFITNLTKLHKDKFKTMKTDQVDRVYREASRGQIPRFYRLTTDKATGRLTANIEKKKLANLHIHCPDLIFDYRLTMSIELPSHENPDRFQNHTPETERFKKRTSLIHPQTATRIDMTEVVQKSKSSTQRNQDTLEMELEIDMPRLLAAFDNLENDAFTFEELSETFMDNARIINRELIKPAPK